jgi:hypothetical protein
MVFPFDLGINDIRICQIVELGTARHVQTKKSETTAMALQDLTMIRSPECPDVACQTIIPDGIALGQDDGLRGLRCRNRENRINVGAQAGGAGNVAVHGDPLFRSNMRAI